MSDDQRLLAAAVVFTGAVIGYATLVVMLGEPWTLLMAWLLLPFAIIAGTLIHKIVNDGTTK